MKTHPCALCAPLPHVVLAAALGLPAVAEAQPAPVPGTPYAVERVSEPYQGCPGSITFISQGDGGGVKGEFDVNLPFAFQHYDDLYTTVTVVGAGVLAFPSGQTVSFNNAALGTAAAPNALIAVWWEDIELLSGNNGFLGTSLTGTAPNREFCIEWHNFNDEQVNDAFINFKVVLHEGPSGRADVVYGPTSGSVGAYTATMGMEDAVGARPIDFRNPACSPNCQHTDLVAMANTRVTATRDAGVELVAVGVDPPQFGFLGAAMNLPVQLGNLHGATVGPFEVEVRAADNPQMSGAVVVGHRTLSLSPFQITEVAVEVVPPESLGEQRVYFELLVDSAGEVAEVREDNNRVVSVGATRLLPGGPDLAVERVRATRGEVAAGDAVDAFVRIRNLGSVAVVGGQVSVVLSTNPAITGRDLRVGDFAVQLAPGEARTTTVSVVVPAGLNSGSYYVGAVADPDQALGELDEANNGRAADDLLVVRGGALAVTTTQLPAALVQAAYDGRLSAHGGAPPLVWSVSAGQLPAGIGLTNEGVLYGRPAAPEVQTFTARVEDGAGARAEVELTLRVVDPAEPLTIVTRSVPAAVVGQEYAFGLQLTGGPAADPGLTWSLEGGPEGLTVTSQGVLTGVLTEVARHELTVSAAAAGQLARRDLTLDVVANPQLLIVPAPLSSARFEAPYQARLEATGGLPPYTWLLRDGVLPAGMSLDIAGLLAGTPTEVGRFRFVVEVRDSGPGLPAVDRATLVLEVLGDGSFTIVTETLPVGRVGQGYDAAVAAAGGLPPLSWSVAEGRIPDGMVVREDAQSAELRIVGQADAPVVANLLVEAVDTRGQRAQRAFVLQVEQPPAVEVPVETGCRCGGEPGGAGWALAAGLLLLWAARRRD